MLSALAVQGYTRPLSQHSTLSSLFSDTKLRCWPFFKAVQCTQTNGTFLTGAVFFPQTNMTLSFFPLWTANTVNVSLFINLAGTWAWYTPIKATSCHNAMRKVTLVRCRNSFLPPLLSCLGNSISVHHSGLSI
jgi:hypothetical protein